MDAPTYQLATPLFAEADTEARRLGHAFLAPEHLLIAVGANGRGDPLAKYLRRGRAS